MKYKDFIRYAKSMDDYPYEIAPLNLNAIERMQSAVWQNSSPMSEMWKAQNQMNRESLK